MLWRANPMGNHRLESRVRENRLHGSEGGEGFGLSRPLSSLIDCLMKSPTLQLSASYHSSLNTLPLHKSPVL